MADANVRLSLDDLPFFIVPPGDTDIFFILVAFLLVLIVLGFGALYLTIQAWPDRLAKDASKVQLQIVGLLGLISLLTLNNAFWIAGLLVAAIRIPDFLTPLREIAKALSSRPDVTAPPSREISDVAPQETSEAAVSPEKSDKEA